MDLILDYVVINGVRYIPDKTTINIDKTTIDITEPTLVYSDTKQDKVKMRNREYYKKNRDKWKQYNQNKKSKLKTVVDWSSASAFSGALAHRQLTHFNGSSPTSSEETLIPGFSCKHIVFKLSNDHNFGCHLLYFEVSSSHQGRKSSDKCQVSYQVLVRQSLGILRQS